MEKFLPFERFRAPLKYAAALALLFLAGTLAAPLERAARAETRERVGAVSPEKLGRSAGTGVALGTLGGFRTVLADVAWLRAFHFWEKRDPASCLKFAELAMTLAPEQFFFLENTANFIAFEFPVWEIRRRGGFRRVSENVQREIQRRAMNAALALLDDAAEASPDNPKIFTLAAQITLMKTERVFGVPDYEKAATYYRRACEASATAPLFAFDAYARIASENLSAEKKSAARAFLEACRGNAAAAGTSARERFFAALLDEYFPPAD